FHGLGRVKRALMQQQKNRMHSSDVPSCWLTPYLPGVFGLSGKSEAGRKMSGPNRAHGTTSLSLSLFLSLSPSFSLCLSLSACRPLSPTPSLDFGSPSP